MIWLACVRLPKSDNSFIDMNGARQLRRATDRVDWVLEVPGFGTRSMHFSMGKSLAAFCAWLEQTPMSQTIQATSWVVPTVQSIHILAIALVAGSALMIDLRLMRLFAADQHMKDVAARFLPFVWWPLLVLLATGAIMVVSEPARSLLNPIFALKMTLLAAALTVTALVPVMQWRDLTFGESPSEHRSACLAIAVVSMLLWSSIIFAGRWIAYY
jgi:hypothetical protein